jgi:glutamate-1-semialdehyde 2,1-aminomutase
MTRSEELFRRAQGLLPGGVSSPVRAFRSVGGTPRFIASGAGAWLTDADGKRYVDLVLSWGPLILGHAHPEVLAAVHAAVDRGLSYGAPTELELQLAERVMASFPGIEKLRFVCSGTEATMSAVRLARAATGRSGVVKFDGCYHGHSDSLLAAAGSGVATLGLPDSPGVTAGTVADTLVVPYNDIARVTALFQTEGSRIAAVLVEPVAGNMGLVPPAPGFLQALRDLTTRHGALLIFDEVMTGWRVHPGGAQALYRISPDLTCLGKVMGGGLPAAAYGGRRELMAMIAPEGPVYQAGTLAGNPVAMAAGLATLTALGVPGTWERAEGWAARAADAVSATARRLGVPVTVQRVGTMWTPFFVGQAVTNYAEARRSSTKGYAAYFGAMLEHGVYPPPSQFEAAFTSASHGEREFDTFVAALEPSLTAAARQS